jgi:hypothetical protein
MAYEWLISGGSAILGAFAGGYATYKASARLDDRVRARQSAIRRKTKIYVPLRSALLTFQSQLEDDRHIEHGIYVDPPGAYEVRNHPTLGLWMSMKEDGRALSASRRIYNEMDRLVDEAARFNEIRKDADAVFARVGRELVVAQNQNVTVSMETWPWGFYVTAQIYNDARDGWALFGIPQLDPARVQDFERFRASFNADDDAKNARLKLKTADDLIRDQGMKALNALEGAITSIGQKYEKEHPED